MARATRTGQIAGFRTKAGPKETKLSSPPRNGGGPRKGAAPTAKREPRLSGSTRRTKT